MKYLEKFGAFIVLLVIIAFLQIIQTLTLTHIVQYHIYLLIGCMVLLAGVSVARNVFNRNSYTALYILGFLLIIIGSYMFFYVSEYFYHIKNLLLPYWYLVSLYSLPAICVEGGLLTLYTAFKETHILSNREQIFLTTGLMLYLVLAITINFLVIGDTYPIQYHLFVYRILVSLVLVLSGYIYLSKTHQRK